MNAEEPKEYGIRPTPGTCCPDDKYHHLSINILENGAVWQIIRCEGCGKLKRRFKGYLKELDEANVGD